MNDRGSAADGERCTERQMERRGFLQESLRLGTAAATRLFLPSTVAPTEAAADPSEAREVIARLGPAIQPPTPAGELRPTASNPLGPFYRAGAPFRGKLCGPHAAGVAMIVRGRVWGHDSKRPVAGAVLDLWQVDNETKRYSAGGGAGGEGGDYLHRTRIVASESGYYEFETVHPLWYQAGPQLQRAAHIHFFVTAPGYASLITELFFRGDPKQDVDPMFRSSLVTDVARREVRGLALEECVFDMVLAPQA